MAQAGPATRTSQLEAFDLTGSFRVDRGGLTGPQRVLDEIKAWQSRPIDPV